MVTYLDNNATTPVDPEVIKSMIPFLEKIFYNPSSAYKEAQISKQAIDEARTVVKQLLNAKYDTEIIFTGSATESNNFALKGVLNASMDRKHIITTKVEHPAVLEVCSELEKNGFAVTYLDGDVDGNLGIKDLIKAIRPDTALVSIMYANNETGVIFPVEKLSRIVKLTDPKIMFHTDATQTVGKLDIDLSGKLQYVDLLSFSGHKIYAPKGIGVLYSKRGTAIRPFILGGHQERGMRAGTENVPYIVGFKKACEILIREARERSTGILEMRDLFEKFVTANIPFVKINGGMSLRIDNTSNISFFGVEGESILYALNEEGICISTGSACSSGSLAPSHVMQAMRVPFTYAHGSLRVSFGRYNSKKDLEKIIKRSAKTLKIQVDEDAVSEIAKRARKTPRIANKILKRVRDYAQVKHQGKISKKIAKEALSSLEIDELGLDRVDREYLSTIIEKFSGGPVGVETISAAISEDRETIEDVIEPYLIQIGFLNRTRQGRVATEAACGHMGMETKGQDQKLL